MGSVGSVELLIIVPFIILAFVLPIYAAVKAFQAGENGWGIGIVLGMLVPLGFVLAIVYLVQRRRVADPFSQ
ncbi:MAG TPA: hypothetical protein VNB24_08195 [Acidimicrobiales bacterium]|nr:hypothetical protein [Acidimicrobiales bacterium]